LDDLLLFLHVLAAFGVMAAVVVFTVVLTAAGSASTTAASPAQRMLPVAQRLSEIGGTGTLVFGVWLALKLDNYDIFDGWILVALALWVLAAGVGARLGILLQEGPSGGDGVDSRARLLYALYFVATVALLADMIFKPGA